MRTVAPRISGADGVVREHTAGEDQLDAQPATFALVRTPHGPAVVHRWTFTLEERLAIARGEDLYAYTYLDDRPLPQVGMSVGPPAVGPDAPRPG
jgi:hypothetical protein